MKRRRLVPYAGKDDGAVPDRWGSFKSAEMPKWINLGVGTPIDEQSALARLSRIPPDTRCLTGRLMGDPLPGRSALDMRLARPA